jgi:hypothetical protein
MERRQYALPHAETKGARRPLQGGGLAKHDAVIGHAWSALARSDFRNHGVGGPWPVLYHPSPSRTYQAPNAPATIPSRPAGMCSWETMAEGLRRGGRGPRAARATAGSRPVPVQLQKMQRQRRAVGLQTASGPVRHFSARISRPRPEQIPADENSVPESRG